MMYDAYQARQDFLAPLRMVSDLTAAALRDPHAGPWGNLLARTVGGTAELIARLRLTHERPPYNIGQVVVDGVEAQIEEQPALKTPFGTLLHFKKSISRMQPR